MCFLIALIMLVPIQGLHSLQPLSPESSLSSNSEFLVVLTSPDERHRYESSAPLPFASSYTIGNTFQAYLCKNVSESGLAVLRKHPSVSYVEANAEVHITDIQVSPPSWGLQRISKRDLPMDDEYVYASSAGKGVTVYVVDTGIYLEHEDFGGRAIFGTVETDDGYDTDCNGHGTHVAGTVGGTEYGVAKEATLVSVKVLDCSGSGAYSGILAGIAWCVNHNENSGKTGVINLSLGGGHSKTLNDAVNAAYDDGILSVVSAGNDYPTDACDVSPASATSAYTVAAADSNDQMASFTNLGPCVNIWAPGVDITSAWIGSPSATNTISGTSMASPHVAGVAALFLAASERQNVQLNVTELTDLLTGLATSNLIKFPNDEPDEVPKFHTIPFRKTCDINEDCYSGWVCCESGVCVPPQAKCCGGGGCNRLQTCCAEGCCRHGWSCVDDKCIKQSPGVQLFDDTPNINLFNDRDAWDY